MRGPSFLQFFRRTQEAYFSSSGMEGFWGVWLPELEPYLHLSSFFLQGGLEVRGSVDGE